jgi:ribosomal protein S12 methylthiotransferase accessory factor
MMNAHAAKGFKSGTHRLVSPSETLARVQPYLRAMGITRLANVTGLDTIGIPVVMACRPNSRMLAVAQGKGLNLDAAKVSAVMESVETYCAERILLPLKLASYREMLAGHRVVDVGELPRAEDSRFHANLPILWIEGDDWMRGERVWVPYQMVHTAYTTDLAFDLNCFNASTNGLASGNHVLEATSHGICEVIERDAGEKWARLEEAEQDERQIDLASVDDADCRGVLDRYADAGMAIGVWDITSAAGIAAFHCTIVEREEDPLRRMFAAAGSGCHPVREIALLRALTEAAQSRLTAISGGRDDLYRNHYASTRDPEVLKEHRRRTGRNGTRRLQEVPTFEADSFEEDIAWELERLRGAGLDRVVVIDLSLAEFDLAVTRVVIPGMEESDSLRAGWEPGV